MCRLRQDLPGEFPVGVVAPVQVGSAALAAAVPLTPPHDAGTTHGGADGRLLRLSDGAGTVLAACEDARVRLAPTVALIGQALQTAEVAHADETGMRVVGKRHWMHALATTMLTWVACYAKRGKEAFNALGILPGFLGTLIHDGWKSYRDLLCQHGLCNAHHLRELIYVFEELKQLWAGRMIELRVAAFHEANQAGGSLSVKRVADFRCR